MSFEDKVRKKFGKVSKHDKKILQEMSPKADLIIYDELKPPKESEPVEDYDDLPGYKEWCEASETKRFYYFTKLGKVHRGSAKKMFTDLKQTVKTIKVVDAFAKESKYAPKAADIANLMEELKNGTILKPVGSYTDEELKVKNE